MVDCSKLPGSVHQLIRIAIPPGGPAVSPRYQVRYIDEIVFRVGWVHFANGLQDAGDRPIAGDVELNAIVVVEVSQDDQRPAVCMEAPEYRDDGPSLRFPRRTAIRIGGSR